MYNITVVALTPSLAWSLESIFTHSVTVLFGSNWNMCCLYCPFRLSACTLRECGSVLFSCLTSGLPNVLGGPGVGNNISDVLPILSKMIDGIRAESNLYLCHRLDKETTGVMLLARSEEAANHVQELFRAHQVEKKYL